MRSRGENPPGRVYHSACVLTSADHDPVLMVIGGWGPTTVLSDMWFLNMTSGIWSQVLYACKHKYIPQV